MSTITIETYNERLAELRVKLMKKYITLRSDTFKTTLYIKTEQTEGRIALAFKGDSASAFSLGVEFQCRCPSLYGSLAEMATLVDELQLLQRAMKDAAEFFGDVCVSV